MVNPAWIIRAAAVVFADEDTRRKLGWIVAAICSPLILTLALICSLLSGSAEHNNSAVLLCFHGGTIPNKTPAEYVAYIEDMRRSFTLLDDAIAAVNDMTENSDSLDGIRVKAVFYAIFFGEDTPSRRAHRQFVDCFVTYEERTRTITDEDGVDYELEILATVENGGNLYYALAPAGDDEAEEDLEISILKVVEEDGEELFAAVTDENELERVYAQFIEECYEEDGEDEDDE